MKNFYIFKSHKIILPVERLSKDDSVQKSLHYHYCLALHPAAWNKCAIRLHISASKPIPKIEPKL